MKKLHALLFLILVMMACAKNEESSPSPTIPPCVRENIEFYKDDLKFVAKCRWRCDIIYWFRGRTVGSNFLTNDDCTFRCAYNQGIQNECSSFGTEACVIDTIWKQQ